MKNKAIFFDKENTLIKDNGYNPEFSESLIFNDVINGLKLVKDRDFLFFIITNQSGINRGFFTKETFEKNLLKLFDYFRNHGIIFQDYFYCPHLPEEKCKCRKPEILNIKRAEALYNLNLSESYIIGDRKADVLLGINTGMKVIFIERGYPELEKDKKRFDDKNDYYIDDEFIRNNNIIKIKSFNELKDVIVY